MDWNWFFSSVAQSTAAIVGIFGAFIITKIVGNQAEFTTKSRLLDEMIANSKSLRDEAENRYFQWYNKRIFEQALQKIQDDFYKNREIFSPEEYYEKYDFSIFQSREDILNLLKEKIEEYSNIKQKQEQAIKEKLSKLPPGTGIFEPVIPSIPKIPDVSLINKLNDELDLINELIVRIKQHCRYIRNFVNENSANPECSPLVNITLCLTIVLFHTGVIYPLSFLPLRMDSEINLSFSAFGDILFSLSGMILSIVSLVFMVIIVNFLVINNRLKYDKTKIKQLREYSSLSQYSEYLKHMEENLDLRNGI